jgi:uncharacterized protein GlcG (DUF336 family)
MKPYRILSLAVAAALCVGSQAAMAGGHGKKGDRPDKHHQKDRGACAEVAAALGVSGPDEIWSALHTALSNATAAEASGLDLQMWGSVVDRDGVVCAVAFSGAARGDQWPGSRVISAQKANTANAFSLDGLALSTANLYSAVQPGGSLYGLQHSNPVATNVAYGGDSADNGTADDGMVGKKVGGVNVFGGGLALYNADHKVIGAVGVSGDTSCADHMIGWRVRDNLGLDNLTGVGGVSGDAARPDNIVYDITPNANGGTGVSAGGFGHPNCINTADPAGLPAVQ